MSVDELWDELRDRCCASKRRAKVVIQLTRDDLKSAMDAVNKRKAIGEKP